MSECKASPETQWRFEKLGELAASNMRGRNIDARYVSSRGEAFSLILGMIPEGASIGLGDSLTLEQIGVIQAVRAGNYRLFDRYRKGISPPGVKDDGRNKYRALTADVFLTSTNAVTIDGKLVSVDGAGTRVAPMIFGPKKVILAIGANKIVSSVEEGLRRVREVSAPMNAKRHSFDSLPCVETGICSDCRSPERICYYTVVVEGVPEREKGRITVVLIGEELGF